ncbi:MAG: AbrB/MazE/SpoVT family DNA-binding domain-containing protein [Gemmatimonadetes bacterium]|nr:AbrB/MazE/SpoVT family DNA-binding domain-containing protein [Gemmatimonadota bacterium]MYG21807.1 AbrB/MazE/SpoVT family DNA-binding domain-containing protein [Gemmatimonadota bacterium]MYJ40425.1 AbrB/MazE/SpoVT family DNA-binding domain-containing protein [Gemmatimonadota bacterium]
MTGGTTMSAAHRPDPGHPDTERVVIDAAGRLVVPARFRRALGIRGRETVVVGMVGDSLRVHTVDGGLERLQRLARRKRPGGTSAVDAFIAERRHEAGRE